MSRRREFDAMSMPTEGWERRDVGAPWDDRGRPRQLPPNGRAGGPGRAAAAVCGVLAGGLVVLAVGVIAAQVLSGRHSMPGPGTFVVVGHLVGAALGVCLAAVADRRVGAVRWLSCLGVLTVLGAVLWVYWLS